MNKSVLIFSKTALKIIIGIIIVLSLFFGSAGTFYWLEAWIFLIVYFLYALGFYIWLKVKNPELLKERMSRRSEGKWWDRIIIIIYSILLALLIILCGLDAVRFKWTNPSLILKIIAYIVLSFTGIVMFFTMRENSFLSAVVRIQKDRSQTVIKTGPYKYIRHPMYFSIILMILSVPVVLGSLLSLFISGLIVILFIIRTSLEDKTLQKELPGYHEYTREVRYRLFPGIW